MTCFQAGRGNQLSRTQARYRTSTIHVSQFIRENSLISLHRGRYRTVIEKEVILKKSFHMYCAVQYRTVESNKFDYSRRYENEKIAIKSVFTKIK